MKVLFVTSEHPSQKLGGLGTFTKEYVKELRKYCTVVVVYFHFGNEQIPQPDSDVDYVFVPQYKFAAYSLEAQILETASSLRSQLETIINLFKPDIIHCNDRQTYLPFRFDRNVCYSSHLIFCDLLSLQSIDDSYFQELKIEKAAIKNSDVTFFYSEFAQKRGAKIIPNGSVPVIVPLGINPEKFIQKNKHEKQNLVISYFGRFENVQKGYLEFINAVNLLGSNFKEKNQIEYNLYGSGVISSKTDVSLFTQIKFLQEDELYEAYAQSDIVVMPSKYEPFGLTGLEAMASGCLLLVTNGLGMDMYAKDGYNCLTIPPDAEGIARVIKNAVWKFDDYDEIRENAIATAKEWTWERCVKAHIYFYNLIKNKRQKSLSKAYTTELYNMLSKKYYDNLHEQELAKKENEIINQIISEVKISDINIKTKRILVINSISQTLNIKEKDNLLIDIINISSVNKNGRLCRPECLPFADEQYDYVIASSLLENCINIDYSISEIFRICSNFIYLISYNGKRLLSQTYKIDDEKELIQVVSKNEFHDDWLLVPKGKKVISILDFTILLWKKQKKRYKVLDRMVV